MSNMTPEELRTWLDGLPKFKRREVEHQIEQAENRRRHELAQQVARMTPAELMSGTSESPGADRNLNRPTKGP